MDTGAQLSSVLDSLVDQRAVFARCGEKTDAHIAERVYELALVAQEAWKALVRPRSVGPTSAAEVVDALERVDAGTAVDRMANLSTYDLVSSTTLRDPDQARGAARRVVDLLGSDAVWWSNQRPYGHGTMSWNPVTCCTFDGVVAGVGDSHFAIVLQVGED